MANYLGKIKQILNGGLEGKVKTFENLVAYFCIN
jgi:hypothetical protein